MLRSLGIAVATVLIAPTLALAHHGPDHSEKHPEVGNSKKTQDGYLVTTDDGYQTLVHGPDPEHHCKGSHKKKCQPPPPPPPPPPPDGRCATDYYQHVLYAYPTGGTSNIDGVRSSVQTWTTQMDAKLSEASLESGGPVASYKWLCNADGTVRVDAFQSSGNTFSEIVSSARNAGYTSTQAHYSILYDGSGSCGVGSVGGFNAAPRYGVTWKACWGWHTIMHENAHNQGAVNNSAPNASGGWHCTDEYDVMCYSDYPYYPTMRYVCASPERFDCGHDDYFDSRPETDEWLARSDVWNLGRADNRFIRFGAL